MSATSPLPLYNGTTFVFLQLYGANCTMALSFKNSHIPSTPARPMCFNICRGRGLRPDDLLALKWRPSTCSSSSGVIADVAGSPSGWKHMPRAVGSAKSFSLNSENFCRSTGDTLLFFVFNNFQKSAGLYFSRSGSCLENAPLALLQHLRYSLRASVASALFLPAVCLAERCFYLACLHFSSNQGARCLPERFGFNCALI